MPPGFVVYCYPVSLFGLLATWRRDRDMPCASALATSSSGDMQSGVSSRCSLAPTSFDYVVVLQSMHRQVSREANRTWQAVLV